MSSSLWDAGGWNPLIWDMAGLLTEQRQYGSMLHKDSENFLLAVAHNTSAHMSLAQISQPVKFDIKEGEKGIIFPQERAHKEEWQYFKQSTTTS